MAPPRPTPVAVARLVEATDRVSAARLGSDPPTGVHTTERGTAVRYSEAMVPTEYGELRFVVYHAEHPCTGPAGLPEEHVAVVRGDVTGAENVLVRVHSECFTSEVLHSLKCDCREQLDLALRRIVEEDRGVVVYLRQEGRGIGLGNKIRAYALQAEGADTVDANRMLGFADDLRRYDVAAEILRDLGVASVRVMTNNPDKVESLRRAGISVKGRVPSRVQTREHNRAYLVTKRDRMGHLIEDNAIAANAGDDVPRKR